MGKSKIAILGCGWLGFSLAERMILENWTVHGSTRSPEKIDKLKSAGIKPYLIDLSPNMDSSVFQDFFDVDLAFINVPPGRRRENVQDWYGGVAQLLVKTIQESRAKRIVWVSSTGVYGSQSGDVDETTEPKPQTDSQRALWKAEQTVQQSGLDWLILRPSGLVGPNRHPGRWLAGKKDLKNGNDRVNLIHQTDLINICIKLIKEEVSQETFNLSADQHPRKRDYYPKMAEKMGLEPPVYVEENPGKESKPGKVILNKKMRQFLGSPLQFPDPYDFA